MKDRYETTVLSSEQISKILPHRYPFLLVDRVVEFEAGSVIPLDAELIKRYNALGLYMSCNKMT